MTSSINSLPYSFESGSAIDPGAMLMASKIISVPYCIGVTSDSNYAHFFMWAPGFEFRPSSLHSKTSYLRSPLPVSKVWFQVKVQGLISLSNYQS